MQFTPERNFPLHDTLKLSGEPYYLVERDIERVKNLVQQHNTVSLPSYVQAGPSYVQAGPFSDPWLIPQTLGTVSLLQSVDKL